MFCPKCGKEIMDGSFYCSNCGTAQDSSIQSAQQSVEFRLKEQKTIKFSKAKLIWGIVLISLCAMLIFDSVVFKTGFLEELFNGKFNIQNIVRLFVFIGFAVGGVYLITTSKKK